MWRTTALVGVLVNLTLSPAMILAGEIVVEEPVFEPDFAPTGPQSFAGADEREADSDAEDYDATDPAGLTESVVTDFNDSVSFCAAIASDEYVIDCLSERLSVIAGKLPESGEFAEMRAALGTASAQLGAIAVQNPSAVLPSGIARSTDAAGTATTRPLRPVATETLSLKSVTTDSVRPAGSVAS